MCANLGTAVVNDLRYYYPDVVKTRPTTWPLHLRNTIASKAEAMLRDSLENVLAMATPLAGANVERGVEVVITGKHRKQRG